ncbi:MAG: 50S ribosomal protein L18a [Candidatus Diapherotrites archaeon]|nr:50S ribosomal protein L18a [Candidatus Diapherotrites archaeon]
MTTKIFRVKGTFRQNRKDHNFTIDVRALNAATALHRVFSNLGSRHKLKQRSIKIKEVKEIPPEESKSLLVKQLSGE